jgi:integrase/recombinase XerD
MQETGQSWQLVRPARPLYDEGRLAAGGFLARYSGTTRLAYASDLRIWFAWCARLGLAVFDVKRPHLELWAREMEEVQGLARATIGRRLSTVAGMYRFAVIDGAIDRSPRDPPGGWA